MVRTRTINGLPVIESEDLKNNVHRINGMPSFLTNNKTGEKVEIHVLPFAHCVYLDSKFWMPCLNTILYIPEIKPPEQIHKNIADAIRTFRMRGM